MSSGPSGVVKSGLYERRRAIRARFRPAPTPSMCRALHALAQIGPEAERGMRWRWPAFRSRFIYDQERERTRDPYETSGIGWPD